MRIRDAKTVHDVHALQPLMTFGPNLGRHRISTDFVIAIDGTMYAGTVRSCG